MPNDKCKYNCQLAISIGASDYGLRRIQLSPCSEEEFIKARHFELIIHLSGDFTWYNDFFRDLKTYFSGQPVIFSCPIDWEGVTAFDREVLEAAKSIPWGKWGNYGWLSSQLKVKTMPRLAGFALKRNPIPIVIPCHRVLKKDGHLGGFSSGLGWKRFLLGLEQGNTWPISIT